MALTLMALALMALALAQGAWKRIEDCIPAEESEEREEDCILAVHPASEPIAKAATQHEILDRYCRAVGC